VSINFELPTENEINPIPEELEGQTAVNHFLGKTVQDVVAMLDENSLVDQEDLMWMGPKALCFYLPAVLEYLQKQADADLVACIASVLDFRLDHDAEELRPSFPTIEGICGHLLDQGDDYVSSNDKKRFQELLRRVRAASA
jgi:hypothetical protein